MNVLLEGLESFGSTLFGSPVWRLVVNDSDCDCLSLCLIAEPTGPVYVDFQLLHRFTYLFIVFLQ